MGSAASSQQDLSGLMPNGVSTPKHPVPPAGSKSRKKDGEKIMKEEKREVLNPTEAVKETPVRPLPKKLDDDTKNPNNYKHIMQPAVAPVVTESDEWKKGNFRQVAKKALELATEQRDKFGKFRKDEKLTVMKLYEVLGLEEDIFLAPPNELQKRISMYRFPPPDMHMLRDVDKIDADSLEYVLGAEEARLRQQDGQLPIPLQRKTLPTEQHKRRDGISSEATNTMLRNGIFKNMPKTKDQSARLLSVIQRSVLFRNLDTGDIKIIFQAFEQEFFVAGTTIFEQGDDGDRFYLIDSGRCHISAVDDRDIQVVSVFVGDGDTFGELAIMYGTPRAASVTAAVDTMCWWIDRDTYRGTLLKETKRKRDKYVEFLERTPLFQSVDQYEQARIADILEVAEVVAGTVIIREGEIGNYFYLIEEGEVKFTTEKEGDMPIKRRAGDFFGEMALLFDRPRMATVTAVSPIVRLLSLNRANFSNYLGPLDDILRRNAEQYKYFVNKAKIVDSRETKGNS